MDYKEGVDYKLVPMKDTKGNIVKDGKGNPVKTRKFFTKAEKAAMKAPKAAPKASPKASPKATKPKEKPVAKDAMKGYRAGDITTTSLDKPKGGRGNGAAEVSRRRADAKPTTSPDKPKAGRGDGVAEVSRRSADAKINNVKKRLRELQEELDNNSAALAAASLGSGVLTRGNTKATGTPHNPTYGSQKPQPTGPQGRMNTGVSRPAAGGGGRGISGNNPATTAKQLGRGGRMNTPRNPNDFNPFLN